VTSSGWYRLWYGFRNLLKWIFTITDRANSTNFANSSCSCWWISLSILNDHFSRWTWVSRYQNVSILDFIGAKDDGDNGYNWSYKMYKAPVKSSPPTNQHPTFSRPDVLHVGQTTVSQHWRERDCSQIIAIFWGAGYLSGNRPFDFDDDLRQIWTILVEFLPLLIVTILCCQLPSWQFAVSQCLWLWKLSRCWMIHLLTDFIYM